MQYPSINPRNIHQSLPAISINQSPQYPSSNPFNIHQSIPATSINQSLQYPSITSLNTIQCQLRSLHYLSVTGALPDNAQQCSTCNKHQSIVHFLKYRYLLINHKRIREYQSISSSNIYQSQVLSLHYLSNTAALQ
jgi:hypothetical protein